MSKVLIVGCGDLGGAVASQLAQFDIHVIGVRRSTTQLAGVSVIQADVTAPTTLHQLNEIQPEILIYCVAANGQTDEQYQAAYVDGLRNVLATQAKNSALQHVFFVSSTRVYGQETDVLLDETVEALPADFGGARLLEAENLLKNIPCKSTILRLSGIYGAGRLRMINLAAALKTFPENWPAQNGWTNRIHCDDAAAFMVFLVKKVLASQALSHCYIVTDSKPVSQYEVLTWIARQLNNQLSAEISPIKGGKRLSNQAMLSTGFTLQYPDYQVGYQALLTDYFATKTTSPHV
ncbi:MAG: sugar nucleotide-binding protein [Methylotenera sp.]|nr:sugar nucleotide-binding protein [Methylotenera sp.]